jgi:hypothetical protein
VTRRLATAWWWRSSMSCARWLTVQEGRRRGQIRHPSGRRPHARPHERAAC